LPRFQMVNTRWLPNYGSHLVFTIWNPDQSFLTSSLDCFVINIIFYDSFLYKTVYTIHSKSGHFCPDFKWSEYWMSGTGIKLNPKTDHGSVFECWLYVSMIRGLCYKARIKLCCTSKSFLSKDICFCNENYTLN
jgi:hypothetical protein